MDDGQGRPLRLGPLPVAAFCGGVLWQLQAGALLPLAVAIAVLCLAAGFVVFLRPRPAWVVALLALAAGAGITALHGHRALAQRLPAPLAGEGLLVELRFEGLPEAGEHGLRGLARIERVLAGPPGAAEALDGRRVSLRWHGRGQGVRPGERWRLSLVAEVPEGARNPGGFDAARQALAQRAVASARVSSAQMPLRLGPASGVDALRDRIASAIAAALGERGGRFVAALAVGDTRGLSAADWERLRQFGLTHLIAISGFHVGLVAGLGAWAVRGLWWIAPGLARRWRRPQAAAFACLLAGLGYAALAGFSLPTLRTVAMVGVVALVSGLRSHVGPMQALALAVASIAALDPFALLQPGFWLSCGGVAWLAWSLPGIASATDLRTFLRAQWVASLGLLPIAAAFFLQVPLAGPLANLVAIPWISLVVVPLALLGTLALALAPGLAGLLWGMAAAAMDALWWGLGRWPPALGGGLHWIAEPSPWAVALALLGVAVVLLPLGGRWRGMGAVLLLPLLFPPVPRPPHGRVEAWVLALPRGEAVLLRTARHEVLVDAGPAGGEVVAALRALGVREIALRIETAGNAGRLGGVARVEAAFPVRERWPAPGRHASAGAMPCERGRGIVLDGVRIEALAPLPVATHGVASPCVLRVRDAEGRELWHASEASVWTARRLAADARQAGADASRSMERVPARAVLGGPEAVLAWQQAMGAGHAVATRRPGPARLRHWPAGAWHPGREGAVYLDAGGGVEGESGWRLRSWSALQGRWWNGEGG